MKDISSLFLKYNKQLLSNYISFFKYYSTKPFSVYCIKYLLNHIEILNYEIEFINSIIPLLNNLLRIENDDHLIYEGVYILYHCLCLSTKSEIKWNIKIIQELLKHTIVSENYKILELTLKCYENILELFDKSIYRIYIINRRIE